jgi:hypothetical protein
MESNSFGKDCIKAWNSRIEKSVHKAREMAKEQGEIIDFGAFKVNAANYIHVFELMRAREPLTEEIKADPTMEFFVKNWEATTHRRRRGSNTCAITTRLIHASRSQRCPAQCSLYRVAWMNRGCMLIMANGSIRHDMQYTQRQPGWPSFPIYSTSTSVHDPA